MRLGPFVVFSCVLRGVVWFERVVLAGSASSGVSWGVGVRIHICKEGKCCALVPLC